MNNKVILKMNKYNLTSLSITSIKYRTTKNRNQIIDTANTKRKTGNSDISQHIGQYTIRVIIGNHCIRPQN